MSDDLFADFDETITAQKRSDDAAYGNSSVGNRRPPRNGGGDRGYAQEIFSEKIMAKLRTFFIDVKEGSNGKFIKISEKSNGRKSTIMMDAEDLESFISALQNAKSVL